MTPEEVAQWREDAIADGWSHAPTYRHEDEARAMKLRKGEFQASSLARPASGYRSVGDFSVSLWGPPGELAIKPPIPYDWDEIQRLTRVCRYCGQEVEKTVRLGFAGRACPECREQLVSKVEYPGWDD